MNQRLVMIVLYVLFRFFGINYVLSIRIMEFDVDLGLVCICFAFSVYFKIAENNGFYWES